MVNKMDRNGLGIMLNRLLWSSDPNERMHDISNKQEGGMRIKHEKPYSVRLERLYSSNDIGAFLDILSITLSFFLGFVLLSVVVVLLRSWLYY